MSRIHTRSAFCFVRSHQIPVRTPDSRGVMTPFHFSDSSPRPNAQVLVNCYKTSKPYSQFGFECLCLQNIHGCDIASLISKIRDARILMLLNTARTAVFLINPATLAHRPLRPVPRLFWIKQCYSHNKVSTAKNTFSCTMSSTNFNSEMYVAIFQPIHKTRTAPKTGTSSRINTGRGLFLAG